MLAVLHLHPRGNKASVASALGSRGPGLGKNHKKKFGFNECAKKPKIKFEARRGGGKGAQAAKSLLPTHPPAPSLSKLALWPFGRLGQTWQKSQQTNLHLTNAPKSQNPEKERRQFCFTEPPAPPNWLSGLCRGLGKTGENTKNQGCQFNKPTKKNNNQN